MGGIKSSMWVPRKKDLSVATKTNIDLTAKSTPHADQKNEPMWLACESKRLFTQARFMRSPNYFWE